MKILSNENCNTESNKIYIRLPEVACLTGLSRKTILRYEKLGEFPKHRRFGEWNTWQLSSVEKWIDEHSDIEEYYQEEPCESCNVRHMRCAIEGKDND